jgi:multidrug efflux pump subunit AcrA (membrane-fusion protein)
LGHPTTSDTDRLTLEALDAAVAVAQANIIAQEAQLRVLNQQKVYQSVVAPFDGVITQRNADIGTLVQADAASGTFLFTLMHSDTIRIQLYVPQDEAFGLSPGVEAVVRVPEMPGRWQCCRFSDLLSMSPYLAAPDRRRHQRRRPGRSSSIVAPNPRPTIR